MADTLEEIYEGTHQLEEILDGPLTLFSTDANTAYVIKDIKVINGDTAGVNFSLSLGDFPMGNLASNLAGSEIIPPSSTVYLRGEKATYTGGEMYLGYITNDDAAGVSRGARFIRVEPWMGELADDYLFDISALNYHPTAKRALCIKSTDGQYTTLATADGNSQTNVRKYNSVGTEIVTETTTYRDWCYGYDGYVYRNLNSDLQRMPIDGAAGFSTLVSLTGLGGASAYPRLYVSRDVDPDGKRMVIHHANSTSSEYTWLFDFDAPGTPTRWAVNTGTAGGVLLDPGYDRALAFYWDGAWWLASATDNKIQVGRHPLGNGVTPVEYEATDIPSLTNFLYSVEVHEGYFYFIGDGGEGVGIYRIYYSDLGTKYPEFLMSVPANALGLVVGTEAKTSAEILSASYANQPFVSIKALGVKTTT